MNTVIHQPFGALDTLLDQMIALQREEQAAILDRKTDLLPNLCARIDQLGQQIEQQSRSLGLVQVAKDAPKRQIPESTRSRLQTMDEVAHQNHLLIEHSLWFLGSIFEEVLGMNREPKLYDPSGIKSRTPQVSGMMLNLQL
jgi:hypothetical protein